jgi:diguanylate cyclase (GGDEF)-like protein/PAS domain S-box-containing protein
MLNQLQSQSPSPRMALEHVKNIALDAVSHGIVIADPKGHILYVNRAYLAITGYTRAGILGKTCRFLQGPLTDLDMIEDMRAAMRRCTDFSGEILNYRKNGSVFWNDLSITVVRNKENRVSHLVGAIRDITERVLAQKALYKSEQSLQLALSGGNLGSWDWQYESSQLAVNARWMSMLGIDPSVQPTIDSWRALIHSDDQPKFNKILDDVVRNPAGRDFEVELRVRHTNGNLLWILSQGAVVERTENGEPVRISGTHLDITVRKESEADMYRLAYYDVLTGLPNRRLLLERLSHALATSQHAARSGALLFIDLDNFKQINDARGHWVGDALLQQVGRRLSKLIERDDTVARFGGDEFVVLVNDLKCEQGCEKRAAISIAERLRESLFLPFDIDGLVYHSSGSVGVSFFPKPNDQVESLLREADTAMYRAKANDNHIVFFEAAMHLESENRLALEHNLKAAITNQLLEVYVQPQVNQDGFETGGELLLRWRDNAYGQVEPARFISIAEACGQIIPLGYWVIEQACHSLLTLQAAGCKRSLSVNVSPRQVAQEGFVEEVKSILTNAGVSGDDLIFEVTENLFIDNLTVASACLAQLAELGIRFSIDDFGTGYSSLAYLKRLPLYELKIDRSFVQDIADDANDKAIVHSILSVAHHLNLQVVAEGVETQKQADFLIASGCDAMQGFWFSRPQPLSTWLSERCAVC